MNNYITGAVIKTLREKKRYTQSTLAELLGVSDKAVSKWETGKGLLYSYCNRHGLMRCGHGRRD